MWARLDKHEESTTDGSTVKSGGSLSSFISPHEAQNLIKESTKYIAHAKENSSAGKGFDIHLLEDHLRKVAKQAQEFAKEFGADDWAYPAGLWHDLGKYRETFQAYIQRGTGINPDAHIEKDSDPRTNHASSGAIYAIDALKKLGEEVGLPLAYIIAGHHAGLPDYEGGGEAKGAPLREVLERDKSLLKEALREQIPEDILSCDKPVTPCPGEDPDGAHLWIRMLFSCLVDADFLDTESFMSPHLAEQRPVATPLDKLLDAFNEGMTTMTTMVQNSELSPVNKIRAEFLSQCREAATKAPGIFTLTVPTGGGKTLSSLAFALEHAIRHKKRRIIYAIPYTSIIEQTAEVFNDIVAPLGGSVLEHHSNVEPDKESQENAKSRLATENWDAPIVVTTTVQLFESLFAARTSRCRKLHNIANSVVVLDEVQLLPLQHLAPIRKIIALLAQYYGVTFVLSTATPTGLSAQSSPFGKKLLEGLSSTEIVRNPGKYYDALKRVRYNLPADFTKSRSWADTAKDLEQYDSVLVIVNKRQDAKDLFDLMPSGTYHLSALMCAAHRSCVIEEIKDRLKEDIPTKVVSTQLVEAGVDFDFPVVYRAMAGLDSIVQAAGRCNREGKLDAGQVVVFVPPSKPPPGTISTAIASCKSALNSGNVQVSIDTPQVFERYFSHLFAQVELDTANMQDLLERDAGRLQIQFRTAAHKFRMIDDANTHTVYVRYGEETDGWLEELKFHVNRELLRKLQRYSVTVYNYQFDAMFVRGDIEEVSQGFYAQSGGGIYDDKLGLLVGEIELTPGMSVQ